MAVTFSADEIFALAEQIERNGAKYYRKAAQATSDPQLKKTLEDLAIMEIEHEQTFVDMRSQLKPGEQPEIFDDHDEVGLYLQALAEGRIFDLNAEPADLLKGNETAEEIIHTAVGLEKDSIILYLGLEQYVPAEAGKDKIMGIIKQEMGHIVILKDKLKSLEA